MISNPVLKREFLTGLRTTRAFILGVVYLLMLAGLVMLMWPAEGVYSLSAQSSRNLFVLLSMGLLALVVLCAPSFTAVSISMEKERETYEVLYDTMLRPHEIVIGKLVAGTGYVLILVLASLPMMGACFILGGVSLSDVLDVYMIVASAAVFFGLVGMYCSSRCRSSFRSLILCYVAILSVCGLTWVPSVILGQKVKFVHYLHLLRSCSPFSSMVSVVNPSQFLSEHATETIGLGMIADGKWPFIAVAGVGSLICFVLTLLRVARPPIAARRDETIIESGQMETHLKFPFYLFDPRKRKRMIGSILNVIAVKEMRSKAFSRIGWVFRSMWICFVASLVLAFAPLPHIADVGSATIALACISMPLAIIILLSPVLTATAICGERESGIFDMLRSTRVGAWTLVMGKLEVAWFFTAVLLSSTIPTFFVLVYISSSPTDMQHLSSAVNLVRPFNFQFAAGWEELKQVDLGVAFQLLKAFGVVGVSMFFATISGVTASTFCRKTSNATAMAYGIVFAFSIGSFIPYFASHNLPAGLVNFFMTFNPFAAAAKAVSNSVFPDLPPDLWVQHIYFLGAAALLMLFISMFRVWLLMRPQK